VRSRHLTTRPTRAISQRSRRHLSPPRCRVPRPTSTPAITGAGTRLIKRSTALWGLARRLGRGVPHPTSKSSLWSVYPDCHRVGMCAHRRRCIPASASARRTTGLLPLPPERADDGQQLRLRPLFRVSAGRARVLVSELAEYRRGISVVLIRSPLAGSDHASQSEPLSVLWATTGSTSAGSHLQWTTVARSGHPIPRLINPRCRP